MIQYHGLSLRDLDDMTPEGLAMLGAWLQWAVADHNKRNKGGK